MKFYLKLKYLLKKFKIMSLNTITFQDFQTCAWLEIDHNYDKIHIAGEVVVSNGVFVPPPHCLLKTFSV
jgi:hypothetical protein